MELDHIYRESPGKRRRIEMLFFEATNSDAEAIEKIVDNYAKVWFIGFKSKGYGNKKNVVSRDRDAKYTTYMGFSVFHGGFHYAAISNIKEGKRSITVNTILPHNKGFKILNDIIEELDVSFSVVARENYDGLVKEIEEGI
ncbi:hypothetical protein KY332_00640 [Candidatus Woesearchaeota archaeon]|nr:hypothetical protein [Candidatus Woesearchaeota archaeon]